MATVWHPLIPVVEILTHPTTATAIALTSLVATLVLWWVNSAKGAKHHRETASLNERLVVIEEERHEQRHKAALVASLDSRSYSSNNGRTCYYQVLVIRNTGRSEARSVHGNAHPSKSLREPIDVQLIGPGASVTRSLDDEAPEINSVAIEWVDDSGEPGRFETHF